MKKIKLTDIDLLEIGNNIVLAGSIWTDESGKTYLATLPKYEPTEDEEFQIIEMDLEDWKKFARQCDLMETKILVDDGNSIKKAIVRKTTRAIDNKIKWNVFHRDNYTCRYTGQTGIPLSVDHIDLWENGGATIEQNLLTVSKKANRLRGNMPYEDWINSETYKKISKNLPEEIKQANIEIINRLEWLKTKRQYHKRSR